MSIVVERRVRRGATAGRLGFTLADLAALPDELPSGPVLWELWDGELIAMSPPGFDHGSVETRIATVLTVHGEWEEHGRVSGGEVGVVIRLDRPQTCVGVDVVFLTKDQLPAQVSPEGYLITMPALIVEVRGKKARRGKVGEKLERYLERSARLVWDVDPGKKTVTAHRPGQAPQVLGMDDDLTAEGIIPNLKFPVRRLFENLP